MNIIKIMKTLISGHQVDNYSEEWREECEARSIVNMPTIQQRRDYLAYIRKNRGEDSANRLENIVREIWEINKQDKKL